MTAAPASSTAVRPSWQTVPAALRDAVASRAGSAVTSAVTQAGGFTPGLAARLALSDGSRLFVKAVPAGHAVADAYQREALTAALLAAEVPAPALRWTAEVGGWLALAYDDVDGRHPDLSPPAPDLPAVLAAVRAAHVPVSGLPKLAEARYEWLHGWSLIAASRDYSGIAPWAVPHILRLSAAEMHWVEAAGGDRLVHGDLRADNMLVTGDGVKLVDWAHATIGAPWPDYADLGAQMVISGYQPAHVEALLTGVPEWRPVPPDAVTSYLIALTGYWTRSSRLPAPPSVPALRPYQARAAAAGLRWVEWRTDHGPALS